MKEKPQNVHLKLFFCHGLDRFNLPEHNDLTCLTQIAFYGFLNKNFQEIKLFICHCSFITLAQKTTMRLQMFLYMFCIDLLSVFSFITCHSRTEFFSRTEFCNFACRIQEFLHLQCAVCCSFSITCALNTAEYRLNFACPFVFSCLFTALYSH